jgi:triphosphatase
MEIELKLLVAPEDAERLRQHPLLQGARRELVLRDTYYDTPRRDLLRAGAGLRVRESAGSLVQTMKAGGEAEGGLHRRHEFESTLASPAPDPAALLPLVGKHKRWHKLLRQPGLELALAPLFCTAIRRTEVLLRLPQGGEVACAIDVGKIECGDEAVPVCELELELIDGAPSLLFDLALALHADVPLRICTLSKPERGFALLGQAPRYVARAQPLKIGRRFTAEQAFGAIAANCLQQVQANAPGLGQRDNTESLHQMRVGLRRFASALRLYRGLLALPPALQAELDWLEEQLGPARDMDVFTGDTLPEAVHALRGEADFAPLCRAALASARALRAAAAAAVDSAPYTTLVLALSRWLHGCGWRDEAPPRARARLALPVAMFARKRMLACYDGLCRRARKRKGDARQRHRLRIAAKRMRYATEFFASLYKGKRVRPFVGALARLQDVLGKANDAAVAQALLERLQLRHTGLGPEAALLGEWLARRGGERGVNKAWKRFARLPAPVNVAVKN